MENAKIPQHVSIIPDGNRRWARKHRLEIWAGHRVAGNYDNLNSLFSEARRLGVKYLSIWGFSTENWKRNKKEIDIIFEVVYKGLERCLQEAKKEKVSFKHIGRKDRLPKKVVQILEKLENETREFNENYVLLCLDYGGRDEIVRTVNKILKSGKKEINEKDFAEYLDTSGIPYPDLIIRTGGEKRLSGFMPFQSDYAELYFTKTYFPDFDAKKLRKAVKEFSKRARRFGG